VGGLRRISGVLMIVIGVLMVAWQLMAIVGGGGPGFSRGGEGGGMLFGALIFPAGLILFGIQRLRQRGSAKGYDTEEVCGVCNRKKTRGAACPGCGS